MQDTKAKSWWKRLLFSATLENKNKSHKIAYIAVTTALCVVMNMFFEFKLAQTHFSFTLVASMLAGVIIGPLFGFTACFLGDLVGFLYHNSGYAYMPWIGVAMGLAAALTGLIVNGLPLKGGVGTGIKLALACAATFAVCTVAVNTTAFWLLYAPKVEYTTYLYSRLFLQGQIYNSLVNYALFCIAVPVLGRIKPLKITLY